jgi:hypothetical protein
MTRYKFLLTPLICSLLLISCFRTSADYRSDNQKAQLAGGYQWYRGNTHTHARFSDKKDKNDVPKIASWYEKAGYDFLVLSEHNNHLEKKKIFCHDEASDPPKFIMICGLELSNTRHHTALGIDRFIGDEESLQDGVNKTLESGGIPILNHPQHPVVSARTFIATNELNHLEVVNGARLKQTHASEILWDSILSASDGRRVFGVAADDNHFKKRNVGRGWIMVRALKLTKSDILKSIRTGDFYASTGVFLNDISFRDNKISIDSQNGDTVKFIGKYGAVLKIMTGRKADYEITGSELYVRAKITDNEGKAAWVQPVFINHTLQ